MKKRILSLVLICAMLITVIAAFPVSAESNPNNYHQSLKVHALEGTPVVDGQIDDIWEGAEIDTLEYLIAGDGQLKNPTAEQVAEECGIQYRVMWDKDRIYFLIEIHDDEFSPDFFKPDDVTSQSAQWWKTDALFMYVSETGLHTGYSAGNSYQLVLPLTEDYYETAVIRKGEKETGHPVKDGALTRKTVLNGNDMVIELALDLREENVAENHVGQTMSVAFQYHDVDASSDYAKAYTESGANPRTLCICSSNKSPDIAGSGRNNWVGVKLTRDYEVLKGTPELDGEIEDLWTDAEAAVLDSIVTLNGATSESANPDKVDSSTAYAKVIYDDSKVYMLLVAEDDDYYHGNGTDWKNDSFMIKLGEQQDWFSGDNKGNDGDVAYTYASLNTYQICAQVDAEKGAYVRANKGNALAIEYASAITGNDTDGYTFVIEISIDLNVLENKAGNVFYTEFQYNDANPNLDANGNNRDLVRAWNSGDLGMGQANGLAIMRMSETEAGGKEEEIEIEPSLAGDYYLEGYSGVEYTMNFNNGVLTLVDKVDDGVDISGTYTYEGTYDTGIKVYDANGELTGITISQMWGFPTFSPNAMGWGAPLTAGQPPVRPELKLGDNSFVIKVEGYVSEEIIATFTAEKAGKYTLSATEGAETAWVGTEGLYGIEAVEFPYEFELEEGETITFYISTSEDTNPATGGDGETEDEINLVITGEGDNAETGDATALLMLVSLVALIGTGITVGVARRRTI